MRSELVVRARGPIPQRFLLAVVAMKLTNKFHRPRARVPETINASFRGVAQGEYTVFPDLSLGAGSGPFCPSCRSTRNAPLEIWGTPSDGMVCIHPFHPKQLKEAFDASA